MEGIGVMSSLSSSSCSSAHPLHAETTALCAKPYCIWRNRDMADRQFETARRGQSILGTYKVPSGRPVPCRGCCRNMVRRRQQRQSSVITSQPAHTLTLRFPCSYGEVLELCLFRHSTKYFLGPCLICPAADPGRSRSSFNKSRAWARGAKRSVPLPSDPPQTQTIITSP